MRSSPRAGTERRPPGEAGLAAVGANALAGARADLGRSARHDLPLRYARLRWDIQATFGTQTRMTPLPGRLAEALRLVDELARWRRDASLRGTGDRRRRAIA